MNLCARIGLPVGDKRLSLADASFRCNAGLGVVRPGHECQACALRPLDNRTAKTRPVVRVPSRHRCISLGPIVEQRMGCGQQAVHDCAKHGHCTMSPCREFRDCQTCGDYDVPAPTRLARIDGADLGFPGERVFNASIARWGGRWVMAFRRRWDNAEVWLVWLDEAFRPDGLPVKLNPNPPMGRDTVRRLTSVGQEDPQLFNRLDEVGCDQLFCAFVGVSRDERQQIFTSVLFAQVREDLSTDQALYPRYEGRAKWEKNWQWFNHDRKIHAVYSISPVHRVLSVHSEWVCVESQTSMPIPWAGGQMRGGASPVRVGDEYWCFFHDSTLVDGVKTYRQGLYTFEAAPPFRPRRYIPEPVLVGTNYTRPLRWGYNNWYIRGAVLDGDRWIFCGGMHDHWIEIHTLPHETLQSQLREIATQGRRGE